MWQKFIAALIKEERGNVLITVLFFLVLTVFMLALVVDMGYLHYSRGHLQNATDAAALAAAGAARDCGEDAPEEEAEKAALEYIGHHGLPEPEDPGWFSCASDTVTVTLVLEVPLFFGPAFGYDSVTVASRARAMWDGGGVSLVP